MSEHLRLSSRILFSSMIRSYTEILIPLPCRKLTGVYASADIEQKGLMFYIINIYSIYCMKQYQLICYIWSLEYLV